MAINPKDALKLNDSLKEISKQIRSMIDIVSSDSLTLARLKGVGVLTNSDAKELCVVGPVARASGINHDIRKDHPYAAYSDVSFDVPVLTEGDVWAKAYIRLLEVIESISIVEQSLDYMPDGPIKADRPKIPIGEGIGLVEAPRGEDIHYVMSSEEGTPYRLKVRSPSVVNVPSLSKMLPGYTVADAVAIIGGIDPCFCCTDRLAVVDTDNKNVASHNDLLQLSRKKYGRK